MNNNPYKVYVLSRGVAFRIISRFIMASDKVGVLSLKLFSAYVDDLPANLIISRVDCRIDDDGINQVMYVDDICLMAPSPGALQTLIEICHAKFGVGVAGKNRQEPYIPEHVRGISIKITSPAGGKKVSVYWPISLSGEIHPPGK